MFEIPSNPNIVKCIITKDTVANGALPKTILGEKKAKTTNNNNIKKQKVKVNKEETA